MAWLNTWSYRKTVTIKHETGAGEDYQVNFSIGDGAGGDFTLPKCDVFPQDIQVTDDDGETTLDYWVEDLTLDPISMWIEVADDLSTDDVDINFYYGKSGESSASDGGNTFNLFDHFTGSSLDTDKWNSYGIGTITVTGGEVTFTNDQIASKVFSINDGIIEYRGKQTVGLELYGIARISDNSPGLFYPGTGAQSYETSTFGNHENAILVSGIPKATTALPLVVADTYYNYRFVVNGVVLTGYRFTDGWDTQLVTVTYTDTGGRTSGYIGLGASSGRTSIVDYIRVREHNDPEPAFLSAGAEESAPVIGIGAQSQILNPWGFNKYGAVIG